MKLLQGKTVIITGASRGIGKGIAEVFANHGANVAFTYSASAESALALENELNGLGIKAKGYQSNAADFNEAQTFVDAVLADFGISVQLATATRAHHQTLQVTGTDNYMPPEGFDPAGIITKKFDSWSFACSIVEMISGIAPWKGLGIGQISILVFVQKKAPPIPRDLIPPKHRDLLVDLLENCFAYKPDDRPDFNEIYNTFLQIKYST